MNNTFKVCAALILLGWFSYDCSAPQKTVAPQNPVATGTPTPATTATPTIIPSTPSATSTPTPETFHRYTYRVVNTYPHDRNAFTEGLVYEDGFLYEGTGLIDHSTLRKVELDTGKVIKMRELPAPYFGEGITIYGDKVIQLTYHSDKGFVYDKNSFDLVREFAYPWAGWGLTQDGKRLITSDGTATLHFLDPDTFAETGRFEVHDEYGPVGKLNELEYVNGKIYANVWQKDYLVIISPETGRITGQVDLKGLLTPEEARGVDVLNGIAYDARSNRLFVTGKYYPKIFEIELVLR